MLCWYQIKGEYTSRGLAPRLASKSRCWCLLDPCSEPARFRHRNTKIFLVVWTYWDYQFQQPQNFTDCVHLRIGGGENFISAFSYVFKIETLSWSCPVSDLTNPSSPISLSHHTQDELTYSIQYPDKTAISPEKPQWQESTQEQTRTALHLSIAQNLIGAVKKFSKQ